MKRRAAFTLLELLISGALLIGILALLGVVVHRARAIWPDGARRTALMTQGRAALEFMADDLRSTLGTNLVVFQDEAMTSFGSTNSGLALLRVATRSNPARLPLEAIDYAVSNRGDGVFVLLRTCRSGVGSGATAATNMARSIANEPQAAADYGVTNVSVGVAIIEVPPVDEVTTTRSASNAVSSVAIHDRNERLVEAVIEVTPYGTDGLTNQVVATVVFTTRQQRRLLSTNSLPLPPSGTPAPPGYALSVATGEQATASGPVAAGAALHREFLGTVLAQGTLHPAVGAAVASVSTNLAWAEVDAVNAAVGSRSEAAIAEVGGMAVAAPPVDAVAGVAVMSLTSREGHAFGPLPAWPVQLVATSRIDLAAHPAGVLVTAVVETVASDAPGAAAPLRSQGYGRITRVVAASRLESTRLVSDLTCETTLTVTNVLAALLPADRSVLGLSGYTNATPADEDIHAAVITNRVEVETVTTNTVPGGATAADTLLLEEATRAGASWRPATNETRQLFSGALAEPRQTQATIVEGVAALQFMPLCFHTWEGLGVLELWPWTGAEGEGPPVCVDIYLELLDPRVSRRAATMTDETARHAFVERQAIRLTRRVELQARNPWGGP